MMTKERVLRCYSLSGLPNIPQLMWSQWGQPGVPTASDQRSSEVAIHWELRHGGPSETDVSSSVSKSSTRQLCPVVLYRNMVLIYSLDLPLPLISLLNSEIYILDMLA